MEFLIHRDDLMRALTRAQGIVEKRSTTPILSAVLLQATPDGVRVTATDKAMTFVGDFSANVAVPGEVAVDAVNFFQVAKVLPTDTVSVRLGENQRIDVRCGRSSYKLNGYPAAEFPPLPSFDADRHLTIAAADLRALIDQTLFSVAPDDNRYGLGGAHLESVPGETPKLRMVGTDGNRLCWAQRPFTGELGLRQKMLLPRKPLAELRRFLDGLETDVQIGFAERAAVVRCAGFMVQMRLMEAQFPDYRAVLPTTFKRRAVLDREAFLDGLKRAGIFATDGSHSVRFAFGPEELVLTARKLDAGDAREEIPVDFSGEPITVGLNARFVQEVLGVLGGPQVSVELGDTLSPCILRDPASADALFVVMPVRLD